MDQAKERSAADSPELRAAKRKGRLSELDPTACTIFAGNGRAETIFDPKKNKGLIADIRQNGQLTPVIARARNGVFEIVAGSRRLGAIRVLHEEDSSLILSAIVSDISDPDAWVIAQGENAERRSLSPMQRARSWQYAIKTFHNGRQDVFAEAVGCDTSVVSRTLMLLKVPRDVLDAVENPESLSVHFASQLVPKLADPIEAKAICTTASNIARTRGRVRAPQLLDELLSTPKEIADREAKIFDLPDSARQVVFKRKRDGSASLSLKPIIAGAHDQKTRKALFASISSELKKFLLLEDSARTKAEISAQAGPDAEPPENDLFAGADE